MKHKHIALSAVAALSAILFAASALAAATPLTGSVGPGFVISMKKPTKAGAYKLTVNDRADIHNFHITGPGVNKKTSVGGKGKTTWTLTFRKGTYRFVCDPHASSMNGSFTIK